MSQEAFTILSPAGYLIDVNIIAPVNGTGTHGGNVVSIPLPGCVLQLRGSGEFSPLNLSGRQGAIRVDCTTGVAGSAQALAFLAVSPSILLGVVLDATNRPYAILIDVLGNLVDQSEPFGPALSSGVPLSLLLTWDSTNVVRDDLHAAFLVNNEQIADWVSSVPSWVPFVPAAVYVGTSLGGGGFANFLGTIGKVQIGNSVVFPTGVFEISEDFLDGFEFFGVSSITLVDTVAWAGVAPLSGVSTWSANSDVEWAAVASWSGVATLPDISCKISLAGITLAGDATSTSAPTMLWAAASAPIGDASITPDATVAWKAASTPAGDSAITPDATAAWAAAAALAATSTLPNISCKISLAGITLAGNSSQTAGADVAWAAASVPAGNSSFSADATVV